MATKQNKPTDITKTGPQSFRSIREQNDAMQGVDTGIYNALMGLAPVVSQHDIIRNSPQKVQTPIFNSETGDYFGNSQYDPDYMTDEDFQRIQQNPNELRYENQPWYDTLANGVGKMLGTAGTTFLSSLVGLPYGLFQAANQGRWSALWDNDVTKGLADVDKWLEDNMTNYKSQKQQQAAWYDPENLFSMNFIADDVIKNMGFTLGAAASMSVGSGALGLMSKAMNFVDKTSKAGKVANNVLSALFSATGEGMIEARQGVEERNKLEMQKLNDALALEEEALRQEYMQIEMDYEKNMGKSYSRTGEGRLIDNAYLEREARLADLSKRTENLKQRKEAGMQQIEESGQEMGNAILLGNQVLLTAGNLIQFSKGMTKSYDRARHLAESTEKYAKPFGVGVERAGKTLKEGYSLTSKNFGRTVAATKGIITEGSEEMNQQWIQSGSGAYYNREDVNDYWRAKLDPEAYKQTTEGLYTLGKAISKGFDESWGDKDQWEQFVIGGFTGMTGSYMPSKIFNQDKSKAWYNPLRYGEWSGGAIQEVSKFDKQYRQLEKNVNDLNRILAQEDFPSRISSLIGHTYLETQKAGAVSEDDKKAWKDADDKQTIMDMQAFIRAGKLDDLLAIYSQMGENLSDEDIENIIKSTTKTITAKEDKAEHTRKADENIADLQEAVDFYTEKIDELQKQLDTNPENADAIQEEINKNQDSLNRTVETMQYWEQQKENYVGHQYYVGAYVDEEGNRTTTNDELREEIKHNADALKARLDSYLESIGYVNKRTKGRLTKDQEDNLAYLHNMSKASHDRMEKIMAGVRKQLPTTFLLKTSKTPEQLTSEYASSDLTFNKDDNTEDGYVEVDTSVMNDAAFASFFMREIMRGGSIDPQFAETAAEKAAREAEEEGLSEEEKKKRAKERATKKWQKALEDREKEAEEQWNTNWGLLVDNFMNNYKKDGRATIDETIDAFMTLKQDLQDASSLYDQAGQFEATFYEYMSNPSLVDEDRAKDERKAEGEALKQEQKSKFAGKSAQQMKQEVADGTLTVDDLDDFIGADLSDVTDDDVKKAWGEAQKAQEVMQTAAALKNHVQEQLGDNPTQSELEEAQAAMQMIDAAMLAADNPEDISIDMPELSQVPLEAVDPNASVEDVDKMNQSVQDRIADAFNALEEDKQAQNDIPEELPSVEGVDPPQTGDDETTKVAPEVVAPEASASQAEPEVIQETPLDKQAYPTIVEETSKLYEKPNTSGTWRSTTGRFGKKKQGEKWAVTDKPYHELVEDKSSVLYKRSKAIFDYLSSVGAFDRVENASADRIKEGDTIHFMVKSLAQEIYGKDFRDLTDDEKPYALVIFMVNDNGEVLGDLPLAQFEPSYRSGNPTTQVKDLTSFQDKVFEAYTKKMKDSTMNTAMVDDMQMEGTENLNLTDSKDRPLVSKIKQVMEGVVPYIPTANTLNAVAGSVPLSLGIRIQEGRIVTERNKQAQGDIRAPKVGNIGQPYILIPTASGKRMAIPIYTESFDAAKHRGTAFYKLLENTLFQLLSTPSMSEEEKKKTFQKYIDILKGLLQVKPVSGKSVVKVTKDTVSLNLRSLTNEKKEIVLLAPNTGDPHAVVEELMRQLSGVNINISLEYINKNIEAGNGLQYIYNQVIGEIATVSLPENTAHTVNSWFTIEVLSDEGIKPSKAVKPKTSGKTTVTFGVKNYEIDIDKLTITDTATGELVSNIESLNLALARSIAAAKLSLFKDKKRIQITINGEETRTYDIEQDKFVNETPVATETAAEKAYKTLANDPRPWVADLLHTINDNRENFTQESAIEYIKKKFQDWGEDYDEPTVVLAVSQLKLKQKNSLSDTAASILEQPQTPSQPVSQSKTIEQIEEEAKATKLVTRQNSTAWAAIPDALKLKLFNEGATLRLSWFVGNRDNARSKNSTVTVSLSSREALIKALMDANMAAKTGNMKVSEEAKPKEKKGVSLSREKEAEARRWLAKNLPSLSSEERTQFVEKLARMGDNADKYWGSYRSGVVQIRRNAPMGTVYHEAFHYVLDMVLSPVERTKILDIAKKEYQTDDVWQAEERLAEDFRRYALDENATGIVGTIKRWIRKILDKITRYNRISDTTINQLFWKINNGEMAQKATEVESFEETQQEVLKEIRNVQREKYQWSNLDAGTREALKQAGLTEDMYTDMSLEEQQHYVRCRG